jgi:hypothetical protein
VLKQFNVGGHTPLDGFSPRGHFESQLTAHFSVSLLTVIMSSVFWKRAISTIFYIAVHKNANKISTVKYVSENRKFMLLAAVWELWKVRIENYVRSESRNYV